MLSDGVRILDKINRVVSVTLPEILIEIKNGEEFFWSILFLEASGDLNGEKSMVDFENEIYELDRGFFISWKDLNVLSKKFWEIIDILIIGSRNKNDLKKYEFDQEMYESCDIVINMFDSCFWEVFSKDEDLLKRLSAKFKDVIPLKSDFIH